MDKLAYIAGIIDSEGSIELRYRKDGVRCYRIRIKMCDNIILPQIAKWIGCGYINKRTYSYISLSKIAGTDLLSKIYNYLYTKQPRADLFLKASSIKNINTSYNDDEKYKWDKCFKDLKILNQRGFNAIYEDDYHRDHKFSWSWLAGLIDGDGSIYVGKWKIGERIIRKPVLQLSMTNHNTIDYISDVIKQKAVNTSEKRKTRRKAKTIRILPTKMIDILPNLIPYLLLKKELAEIALEICELRSEIPNGQYNHKNVKIVNDKLNIMEGI